MDYRQQQAAAARARLFELQAEQLKKQAEIDQAVADCEMYLSAAAPTPHAVHAPVPPMPVPQPAAESERVGAGVYALVVVAVMMAFVFGSVWRDVSHRERAARQADMQGSWGNSRPASVWGAE